MATSTKLQFKVETLRAKALASIDQRIAAARQVLESLEDPSQYENEVATWRANQEQKISDIFRQLQSIDNFRLATFKLDPLPMQSTVDVSRARARLAELESLRTQIGAKAEAVVPDENGNVALTKTQMQEFFGL